MTRRKRVVVVLLTLIGWLTIFAGVIGVWTAVAQETLGAKLTRIGLTLLTIAIGCIILRISFKMQPNDDEKDTTP